MNAKRGAKRRAHAIGGLGSWAGVRPTLWVRVGSAVAAIAYLAHVVACAVTWPDPIGEPISEVVVVVVCTAAFLIAPRRPAAGAAAACLVVGAQVLIATVAIPTEWVVSPPVLPVVVLATGLFFGARASLWAAGVCVAAYPLLLLAFGRIGPRVGGIPPLELSRLVTTEWAVTASGVLTWLALGALARAHFEAEERRRLEIRLQHMQRLQVVGELASEAAHDFRNLLGIFQNAATVLAGMKEPAARDLGNDLLETARSGHGITRQLLSLARKEEPRRSVIDVGQTVESLRPLVTRLIGPHCELDLRAEGAATALIDPGQVEQVVLNLAANARDAMAGEGRVTVRVRAVPRGEARALGSSLEGSRHVVIEVGDHGTGIAPELHEQIFEPFVTTKPRGQGTGLGLATVRSIATGSGGGVAVESAPGAGATFRVFLPEAEPAESTG